jgi:hypothetical protein
MPRSAATLLGLMLVACSIGFNTVRYPVVWEMVSPVQANQPLQPAAAPQPEKPEGPTAAQPEPPPAPSSKPIEVKPTAEFAQQIVVEHPASNKAKSANGDAEAAEQQGRKALVPVIPVSSSSGVPGSEAAGGVGIRRLPPVEQTGSNLANRDPARSFDNSIPVYPTTGIE